MWATRLFTCLCQHHKSACWGVQEPQRSWELRGWLTTALIAQQELLTENGVHLRKTGLIFILTNIALNFDLIVEGFVTLCNSAPDGALHSLYPNPRDTVSFPTGSAQWSSNFDHYQKLLEDLLKLTAEPPPRFCSRGPEEGSWKLCVLLLLFRFDFVLLCCGTGAQTMVLRMRYIPWLIMCVSDKCVQWC